MPRPFRLPAALIVLMATALPAAAHDFWIVPETPVMETPGETRIDFRIGHAGDVQNWPLRPDRVLSWQSVGPNGLTDQQAGLTTGADADLPVILDAPGLHLVSVITQDSISELTAKRFNDYIEKEGLKDVIDHRERTRGTRRKGVERYSRRGKTLIAVGDWARTGMDHVTQPLGHTLEITPLANPMTTAPGERLALEVRYRGERLPNAVVRFSPLHTVEDPETLRTDADGRVEIVMPEGGQWLLHVVWSTVLPDGSDQPYDTIFSSFSFPGAR
ncbi:MAG: DUF4198 domain-containing protein [Litorimonas sp.]